MSDQTPREMCVEEARAEAKRRAPRSSARRSSSGGMSLGRVMRHHVYRLVLLGAFAGLMGLMFLGQTLTAPDWLRDRIAVRIEQALPGIEITFAEMHFVMNAGWRPRVGVSDLALSDADGRRILELSRAEASLAMRPLLYGQVSPKKIILTGARAVLRRAADGTVALDFGETGQVVEEAANLPDLIEGWEERLLQEPLLALTEFELRALTLRYDDVRSGRSWTVDDGRLTLHRKGDQLSIGAGLAVLSGRSYAASLEASYDSSIRSRAASFGIQITDMAAEDIALQAAALGWLEPLRAPISGAMRGGIDAEGGLLPLNATLRIGAGVLQPTEATTPIPFDAARAYVTFDPVEQVLRFDELTVDSAWGSGTAEGRAVLSGLDGGAFESLVGQFTVGALTLNPAGVYPEPLTLAGAHADFRLSLHPFDLTLGDALIRDGDNPLRLSGALEAAPEGWRYTLNGRIEEIGAARLMEIWPEAALVKPRGWVATNVHAGRLSDVDVVLRGVPDDPKPAVYAEFEFSGAEVTFARTLPPLLGARGQGSFVDHRLVIVATEGQVEGDEGGPIDVAGTAFIVPDVRVKPGTPAIVRTRLSGAPTAVLSLLNRPPLSVLGGSGLPVALAEGALAFEGTLALPMQKKVALSDFEFHGTGRLTGVQSTVLVPGHVLAGEDLTVTLDTGRVEIAGAGTISGVPAEVSWTQPIGIRGAGSQVAGQVELSPEAIAAFNLGLPANMVRGRGQGEVTVDLAPGEPVRMTLASDLEGLTLSLPSLGWRKGPEAEGSLELSATLGAQPRVDRLTLSGGGLTATGRIETRAGGGFDRAVFDRVSLGGWLNVAAELRSRGEGRTPAVRIGGGSLDLGRAAFGSGSGGDAPPLDVTLDRLQVSDGLALTGLRGAFTTAGGLAGVFSGQMNGGAPVSGKVSPQDGASAFEITATDAGAVFRDAGIIKQAHGGDLRLTLLPVAGAEGQYDGALRVTNTRVKEGSGIGALLNAISLVGLIDELAGNGIVFNEVEAKFRLTPTQLILLSSSAIGPSIGVSMDGIYDLASATLDMQGVLSPLYALNIIGSVISKKGEGLIGFNFNLSGPASDPKVSVNPLSALTPGILREVFREPTPTVSKSRTEAGESEEGDAEPRRREQLSGEDR